MRKYIKPGLTKIVMDSNDIITASDAGINDKLLPEGGNIGVCSLDDSTIWSDN